MSDATLLRSVSINYSRLTPRTTKRLPTPSTHLLPPYRDHWRVGHPRKCLWTRFDNSIRTNWVEYTRDRSSTARARRILVVGCCSDTASAHKRTPSWREDRPTRAEIGPEPWRIPVSRLSDPSERRAGQSCRTGLEMGPGTRYSSHRHWIEPGWAYWHLKLLMVGVNRSDNIRSGRTSFISGRLLELGYNPTRPKGYCRFGSGRLHVTVGSDTKYCNNSHHPTLPVNLNVYNNTKFIRSNPTISFCRIGLCAINSRRSDRILNHNCNKPVCTIIN